MQFTRDSPLLRKSPTTADELIAAFEPTTPKDQLANMRKASSEIVDVSAATGIDPYALASIGWIETGAPETGVPFSSPQWKSGFNFGNLGYTGDKTQEANAQTWATPADGVIGSAAHLVAYAYGKKWRSAWDADELGDPTKRDVRFNLAIQRLQSDGIDRAVTFGDLNRRWAIDANDDYGGKLAARATILAKRVEAYRAKQTPVIPPATESEPVPTLKKYKIAKPGDILIRWTPKTGPGYGYDSGQRQIVGGVPHQTQGEGSAIWYATEFFACPNGERCEDALVDYIIDRAGVTVESNDPFGTRIPYGSGGPYNYSDPVGAKFYQVFGDAARNTRLIAVEFENLIGQEITDAQVKSGGRLFAWLFDSRGYDWDDWEQPDQFGGASVFPSHNQIATTNCHLTDASKNRLRAEITRLMKASQTADGTIEVPPAQPTGPAWSDIIIPGMDYGLARDLFNGATKNGVQGDDQKVYGFWRDTKTGALAPVSSWYVERGKRSGIWAPLTRVRVFDDGANGIRKYFIFGDGATLIDPPGDDPVRQVIAATS